MPQPPHSEFRHPKPPPPKSRSSGVIASARPDRLLDELLRRCEQLEWDRSRVALRLCAFIDDWRHESFVGTVICDDVELWRLVAEAVEDLKHRIVPQL